MYMPDSWIGSIGEIANFGPMCPGHVSFTRVTVGGWWVKTAWVNRNVKESKELEENTCWCNSWEGAGVGMGGGGGMMGGKNKIFVFFGALFIILSFS